MAQQLKDIGLSDIAFLTVPFETYQPDPNRLVWAPEADRLWERLKLDKPLTREQARSVTTAANRTPSASPSAGPPSPGRSPGTAPSAEASAEAAEQARENGLCA